MFSSQPRVFTLFFCVALAFTLANVSAAKGPDSMNVNRRDHSNLTRLLKKRVPLPQGGPNLGALVGAAPDPATNTQSSPTSSVGPSSGPQESSSSSSAAIPTPPSPPAVSLMFILVKCVAHTILSSVLIGWQ
jgi:hypothetical protein